ncbi:peptidoglycan-binding domain-containing protein [Jonesiaceae bacterium BS-20]|uniref:Peptidoglycan-binding domain-containing protein n=1 Tax=Jonesiaceae bacterium BS-20 TaxID=3120821 RepID=A0AAU7DX92_9MICO
MRGKTPIIFGVSVLVAVGVGWAGGALMQSPSEAQLPVAQVPVVTAAVEERALSATVSTMGELKVAGIIEVMPSAPQDRAGVISATPLTKGSSVAWCSPLIEVSGRPLLALEGAVPAYRDLQEGDSGPDVKQLQDALRSCGFYSGASDGVFGANTAKAVRQMYKGNSYKVPTATVEVIASEGARKPASEGSDGTGSGSRGSGEGGTLPGDGTPTTREVVAVPASELGFLAAGGTVSEVLSVGTPIGEDPGLRITTKGFRVDARINPLDRLDLEAGMPATISIANQNIAVVLPELPDTASKDSGGTGEMYYPVSFSITEDIDPALVGSAVQVSVVVGADTVHPLVVPVTAIYTDAGSGNYVLRSTPDAEAASEKVSVILGESRGGYAAITVQGGGLAVGDEVVLGG